MEPSSPRGRRKRDTRQRVLKAAAELFATHGYAATSISAICRASGVLPSSLYWEFGNKAGILAAVLEDSSKRWLEQSSGSLIQAVRARSSSNVDPLAMYFDYMAEALAEGPEFLRLMMMVGLERHDGDEASLEIVRAHRQRAIEGIARLFLAGGLIAPSVDAEKAQDIARLAVACFDGAFAAAQIDGATADLRRMFALLRSAMTAALLSPRTARSKSDG